MKKIYIFLLPLFFIFTYCQDQAINIDLKRDGYFKDMIALEKPSMNKDYPNQSLNKTSSVNCSDEYGVAYELDDYGKSARWHHQIKYRFDTSDLTPGENFAGMSLEEAKDNVRSAANKWNEDMSLYVFKEVNAASDITVELLSGRGWVGVVGEPSNRLGNMSKKIKLYSEHTYSRAEPPEFRNTVHHEFAHVLGLRHEFAWDKNCVYYGKCGKDRGAVFDPNSIMNVYDFSPSEGDLSTLMGCSECLGYSDSEFNSYPPLGCSISGPSYVRIPAKGERSITKTWYSNVSGGKSPYTYKWYRKENSQPSYLVSTNSTYSRTYSFIGYGQHFDVLLTLKVTDSDSETATATKSVVEESTDGGGGSPPREP